MFIRGTPAGEAAKRRGRELAYDMQPAQIAAALGLDLETYWLLCMINGERVLDTTALAVMHGEPRETVDLRARQLIQQGFFAEVSPSQILDATARAAAQLK